MTSRYYGRRALLWGVIALLSAAFCLSLHPAAAADRQQQDVTEAQQDLPLNIVFDLFRGMRLISFIVDDHYYLSLRPEYTPEVERFMDFLGDDVREAEEENLEKQLEGKLAKPPTKEGEIFYVTVKTLEGIEVKFRVFEQALRRKKTPDEPRPEIGTVEAEFEKRHN
ncbi:hypothetical protein Efla_007553 [Eimeria flavescens]